MHGYDGREGDAGLIRFANILYYDCARRGEPPNIMDPGHTAHDMQWFLDTSSPCLVISAHMISVQSEPSADNSRKPLYWSWDPRRIICPSDPGLNQGATEEMLVMNPPLNPIPLIHIQ
ncbi:hypothetical protein I7I51_03331 [Histoplasma capsulatum]|uniref:Uncharacterized protein n=1 Tax=Ajellomyces capsulatus TaxID=5037 RepID=A0A8A1M543_AJECA|nr:hypothetical protein I7I51_03331 [Histoplasma capsulatum]